MRRPRLDRLKSAAPCAALFALVACGGLASVSDGAAPTANDAECATQGDCRGESDCVGQACVDAPPPGTPSGGKGGETGGSSGTVPPTEDASSGIVDAAGTPDAALLSCDGCADAFASDDAAVTFLSEAAAPLPPLVDGGGGFNAIWVSSERALYLPLFSAPSCAVVPPYGESYRVWFFPSNPYPGPNGVFASCYGPVRPCYLPARVDFGATDTENIPGGMYELSAFDANGIATGAMDTLEGLVPLTVKNCP